MESSLKRTDHGCVRHQILKLPDGCNIGGIVGRGNRIEICHCPQNILGQILHAGYALCVDDLEAYTGDVQQRFQTTAQNLLQHSADGLPMGGEYSFLIHSVAGQVVLMIE